MLLKLFPATVANADIGSLKPLHTFLKRCLYHMLVKFEQNCTVQTTQNFTLFDTKQKREQNITEFCKTIFDKALTLFWTTFLKLKQLFNSKILKSRLPSFSIPKITVVRHVQPS